MCFCILFPTILCGIGWFITKLGSSTSKNFVNFLLAIREGPENEICLHNQDREYLEVKFCPYIIQSVLSRFESVLLLPLQLDLGLSPTQMRYFSLRQTSCLMENNLDSYIVYIACLTLLI